MTGINGCQEKLKLMSRMCPELTKKQSLYNGVINLVRS